MASSIWVLGTGSPTRARDCEERFAFPSGTAKFAVEWLSGPSARGLPMLVRFDTETMGRTFHSLRFEPDPEHLWALSTACDDARIRHAVACRLGYEVALRALAHRYPGGTARGDLARRIGAMRLVCSDEDRNAEAAIGALVDEVVDVGRGFPR